MSQQRVWLALAVTSILVAGCGENTMGMGAENGAQTSSNTQDYGTTKQMVIDILHSSEGKAALLDILKEPTFKQQLAVSNTDVSKAVAATLQSSKNKSFLASEAANPEFAAALAKATQPEMMSTMKQLLRDPDSQKDILVLLKSSDFTTHLQDQMKTPEFRKSMMSVMTQALDNPAFRMKFQDALKKAVADAIKNDSGSGGKSGGGSGGDSGKSSGGDSQSGSDKEEGGSGGGGS